MTAQNLLHRYYYDGTGTEKDMIEAFAWAGTTGCYPKPAFFNKGTLYGQELSEKEFQKAKKLACTYSEKYVVPYMSEKDKKRSQEMRNKFIIRMKELGKEIPFEE